MTLSIIERVLLLKSVDLFSHIPSEDLVSVAEVAREVRFQGGERFIQKGDIGNCLYVLIEGEVGIEVPNAGQITTLRPPNCIGEMALITRQPRSADCVALQDIETLRIDRDDFQDLLADQPTVALGIIDLLAYRLTDTMAQLGKS
jgi:CRP/FNR family cyclic AMP-dependent transcriptional regulator